MLSSNFHSKENHGIRVVPVYPGHAGLHKQWPRLHEHHNHWWRVLGVRVRPETVIFHKKQSDKSTKHYLTQMLLAINWRYWQAGKRFTHAYEGSRSAHASVLHWNPPDFRKKVRYFSNRVIYIASVIIDHTFNDNPECNAAWDGLEPKCAEVVLLSCRCDEHRHQWNEIIEKVNLLCYLSNWAIISTISVVFTLQFVSLWPFVFTMTSSAGTFSMWLLVTVSNVGRSDSSCLGWRHWVLQNGIEFIMY